MIYTRWDSCEIVATFGEHKPPYFEYPAKLIMVRYNWEGKTLDKFYWADFLKAGDGWPEIEAAMKSVPEYHLSERILKAAFVEAE